MSTHSTVWQGIIESFRQTEDRYRQKRVQVVSDWTQEVPDVDGLARDFVQLADYYATAPGAAQCTVAEFLAGTDYLVREPAQVALAAVARRFIVSGDPVELQRALALISMCDARPDYRDTYQMLGQLYIAAVRHGLDGVGALARAAEWSGGGGITRTAGSMLRGFTRSAYFDAMVKPALASPSA